MIFPHTALFTSRSSKSSVGLRPQICRTIEQTFSMWCTVAGDIWNLCGHFSASSFRIPWIFWNSGCNKFPCHFFARDCSMIQIQKIPMIPDFYLSRQVSLQLQPSTRQGMHLSAFLENSTLRRVFEVLLALTSCFPEDASSIIGLFDAIGWFTDDVRFIAVGFDFATILSSSFCSGILFAIVLVQASQAETLSAASGAEMADVEQMEKIVPFITCEITFCQYVCNLVFGVDATSLNFRIKINPVKQPIQSNSVGSAHMSHCRTPVFNYHLNHGFIVLKNVEHSTTSRRSHVGRNVNNIVQIRIEVLSGFCFYMWSVVFPDRFPCDSWPLDLLIWFGEEWNISITKHPKIKRGNSFPRVNLHPEK